jgi:hypothetical protein
MRPRGGRGVLGRASHPGRPLHGRGNAARGGRRWWAEAERERVRLQGTDQACDGHQKRKPHSGDQHDVPERPEAAVLQVLEFHAHSGCVLELGPASALCQS